MVGGAKVNKNVTKYEDKEEGDRINDMKTHKSPLLQIEVSRRQPGGTNYCRNLEDGKPTKGTIQEEEMSVEVVRQF
jgi:hypothetical protein